MDISFERQWLVLVVDDEPQFRKALKLSLAAIGYSVLEAPDGRAALNTIGCMDVDLVVLDMSMPEMDGVTTCKQILSVAPRTAIVMMTVRDAEEDRLLAFEAGADDYITKPFRFRELSSRLRAVLRRVRGDSPGDPDELQAGSLILNLKSKSLWKDGRLVAITTKEFELASFLMKNAGSALTQDQILEAIHAPRNGSEVDYLRTYIRLLRKKIEDDPSNPTLIRTESWFGYRFCIPNP